MNMNLSKNIDTDRYTDRDTDRDRERDGESERDRESEMNRDRAIQGRDVITPLLLHRQPNFEVGVSGQFHLCVPVKLPYGPNSIP